MSTRAFETVHVYVSSVIPNVSAPTVWSLIGSFNGLSWFDRVSNSEMENNQSDNTIGAIRKITFKNGKIMHERLIAMDLRNQSYTYTLLDGIPWEDYNNDYYATISVKPITTNDGIEKLENTLLEWRAEFTCPHGEGKKWKQVIEEIFEYGIKCIQNIYNK